MVHVKNEPHSSEKVRQGRGRLILATSMSDQMLDVVGTSLQNHTERDNWKTVPTSCGMGFNQESVDAIIEEAERIYQKTGSIEATDVSGWDFGVSWFEYEREIEHRVLLAGAKGTQFEIYIYNLFRCRALSVFVLSDGTCFEQLEPGIMKSGMYCTTSSNSRIRVDDHYLIGGKEFKSNGDDGFGDKVEGVAQKMLDLGHIITPVPADRNRFEFCSHVFTNGIAYTVNAPKMTFALLGKGGDRLTKLALLSDYIRELVNLPEKDDYLKLIYDSGWLPAEDEEVVIKQCLPLGFSPYKDQNGFRAKQNAERLHGSIPKGRAGMYSPIVHVVSNIMNKKNNVKTRRSKKPKSSVNVISRKLAKTRIRDTPYTDAGGAMGTAAGAYFGVPAIGRGVGRFLGAGIGSIFGSGDYTLVGESPKYNVLSGSVPQFSATKATNIVCHREYLGDITGSAGFTNYIYPLNPGMNQTFPWLSTVAQNYQEYRFHGIIFEFRPLITDFVTGGAPGTVVMATNYNSDAPTYSTKQAMENSEFAVSTKPTLQLMHAVECKLGQTVLPQAYVRTGVPPSSQDLRLYDLGNFQFATQSNPVQNLGELWVTYCVEFFKPILPNTVGGEIASYHAFKTGGTALTPCGTTNTVNNSGSMYFASTNTSFSWFANPSMRYLVSITWTGTVAVAWVPPTFTSVGTTLYSILGGTSGGIITSPDSPENVKTGSYLFIAQGSLLTPNIVTVTFGTAGVIPVGGVEIFVTQLDQSVIA